jgi:hypothetical protein
VFVDGKLFTGMTLYAILLTVVLAGLETAKFSPGIRIFLFAFLGNYFHDITEILQTLELF